MCIYFFFHYKLATTHKKRLPCVGFFTVSRYLSITFEDQIHYIIKLYEFKLFFILNDLKNVKY